MTATEQLLPPGRPREAAPHRSHRRAGVSVAVLERFLGDLIEARQRQTVLTGQVRLGEGRAARRVVLIHRDQAECFEAMILCARLAGSKSKESASRLGVATVACQIQPPNMRENHRKVSEFHYVLERIRRPRFKIYFGATSHAHWNELSLLPPGLNCLGLKRLNFKPVRFQPLHHPITSPYHTYSIIPPIPPTVLSFGQQLHIAPSTSPSTPLTPSQAAAPSRWSNGPAGSRTFSTGRTFASSASSTSVSKWIRRPRDVRVGSVLARAVLREVRHRESE